MFQVGDRVRCTQAGVRKDRVGTVKSEPYTKPWGGPYIRVQFDGDDLDGGWYPHLFEMDFKAGDYVRIKQDPASDAGARIGTVGKIEFYDGSKEGFWPYRVEFADGDDEIYNAADLEHSTKEEFGPKVEVVTVVLEDEYIEGYLVTDENNEVLTAWDDYESAYNEAKEASGELDEPLFVYKLVTAFEPGMGKNGRIYNLV